MTARLQKVRTASRLAIAKAMARKAFAACRARPLILAYHRVIADASYPIYDEPGMGVYLRTFEEHMGFLRESFEPMPLAEMAEAVSQGRALPAGACAVTFDDGWADAGGALPVLRRLGISATMFTIASPEGGPREFWTRRFLRILSSAGNGGGPPLKSWPPGAARSALAHIGSGRLDRDEPLRWLASLPAGARERALGELADHCGVDSESQQADLMTPADLRAWAAAGMEIGSHGLSHGRLTNTPLDAVESELVESKELLQDALGVEIKGFSYPYGAVNSSVRALVARAGYSYACATESRASEPLDVFTLPRRTAHEGVAADLEGAFSENLFVCYLAGVFDRRRR
jgi:peptidoglycan/xylan/chitin deacetylase (PgdA/CDA1 family)